MLARPAAPGEQRGLPPSGARPDSFGTEHSATGSGSQGAAPPSFGTLITQLSESEGAFFSPNLVSNERHYLDAAAWLRAAAKSDAGVYLGVGPEQNLSYIALLRPRLAFIVDIRRDNLLQHLIYKRLFERSPDRSGWLAALLGRDLRPHQPPAPDAVADDSGSAEQVIEQVRAARRAPELPEELAADVIRAMRRWALEPLPDDAGRVRALLEDFARSGLDTRFETTHPRPDFPTLKELLLARDPQGTASSFLGSAEAYRAVRALHAQHAIIPLVGDLAGKHTLKAIAKYLVKHRLELSVFYASNVEQYLLLDERWGAWRDNVRALPADPAAFILRSYSDRRSPLPDQGQRLWQLLRQPVAALPDNAPASYRALALASERPTID